MFLFSALLAFSSSPSSPSVLPTPEEALNGWIALWDGTITDWEVGPGWKTSSGGRLVMANSKAGPRCRLGGGEWKLRTVTHPGKRSELKIVWRQDEGEKLLGTWKAEEPKTEISFRTPTGKHGVIRLEGANLEIVSLWHKPDRTEELIEGKGLSGWKLVPGKKSKAFTTPEGWIRIQDGPGDLQSENTYTDFVAQLTLRTGGKHLNSGFFFRAIPGEQWQGYEAQIRNEFTPDTYRAYFIDSFDAKSHQPTGKIEVKSTAVDYGSGAIYRRMPARSAAAQDNEWFTLTVSAVGREICTWVQGQPQVVWKDNRPENANARQGFRAKAGVFGIQGHDPTTLIDFRSLRVLKLD